MTTIIHRSARILNIEMDEAGAREIAGRSRGTPRIGNFLLKRVRDYAQVRADGIITRQVADKALKMLEIDELGLDEMDRAYLEALIHKFDGGPVGIKNLAVSIGEESDTLEEVYEPYLIQQGFVKRTSKGRIANPIAYKHLNAEHLLRGESNLF
ncbi:MAG: Holliday junction branch migration DNA helicase RuvB, partial [Chlamydiae bacterium]